MDNLESQISSSTKALPLDMEKWRIIIADWESSKESQRDYCNRLGIRFNTFSYARSKLTIAKRLKPEFIPVKLNYSSDQGVSKSDMIILENSQGFKLHVSSSLSLERLAKIFKLCGWC